MDQIILTRQNARHTKTVRHIETGEVFAFEWRGDRDGALSNIFFHTVSDGFSKARLRDSELKDYEVVESLYTPLLDDLWNLAYDAFRGYSFSPDRRQEDTIHSYEAQLMDDLKQIPAEGHERYIAKYKEYLRTMLAASSRCYSTMITGAANFNHRRNDKMKDQYQSATTKFSDWRDKALERIKESAEKDRRSSLSDAERVEEDFEPIKKEIIETYGIKASWKKALLYSKLERIAQKGNVEMIERAMSFMVEMDNKDKPIFTQRHKIYKLPELAATAAEQLTERKSKENEAQDMGICEVVRNFEADRLQLLFDGKPSPEVIAILKSKGYRWSPRYGAWQRQLTVNATSGLDRLIESIKKAIGDSDADS